MYPHSLLLLLLANLKRLTIHYMAWLAAQALDTLQLSAV
jgi:hypothetical protein